MAKPRGFDYGEVVRSARDLFWERGYEATSLSQLLAVTGLSKSTLYQTCGSKRGLFAVAVESYLAEVMSPLITPMEADGAGRAELVGYFTGLAEMIRTSPHDKARRGCFMLNTFMELEDLDDAARVVSAAYRNRVRDAIHHVLVTMADTVRDPVSAAEVLTAAKMGLMVTSRVDPGPGHHAGRDDRRRHCAVGAACPLTDQPGRCSRCTSPCSWCTSLRSSDHGAGAARSEARSPFGCRCQRRRPVWQCGAGAALRGGDFRRPPAPNRADR